MRCTTTSTVPVTKTTSCPGEWKSSPAISRFWAQRVNWSEEKQKYVILGVTGPNEYENNVHNNWYTNYIASWTLRYTAECARSLELEKPAEYAELSEKLRLFPAELTLFSSIADQIYLPEDKKRGIFLQQDGFLDKELRAADTLEESDRPPQPELVLGQDSPILLHQAGRCSPGTLPLRGRFRSGNTQEEFRFL